MELMVFQEGFNYSQDGPGNRLVYHLQGCNMRCPWCANPEGLSREGTLLAYAEHLTERACPKGAVAGAVLDRSVCAGCVDRPCLGAARSKGIGLSCAARKIDALVQEAQDAAALLYEGGGVTLSGGEPTMQFASLKALLQRLRAGGIDTAVETNGTHPALPDLFPLVDHLIMDCKHWDARRHVELTCVPQAPLAANLRAAFAGHGDLLVRVPLIGGRNAGAGDAESFGDFFLSLGAGKGAGRVRFEFLRYHEYGKDKWARCGLEYTMDDASVPASAVEAFEAAFARRGLETART